MAGDHITQILIFVLVNRLITVWVVLECAKIKVYRHGNHKLKTGARTTNINVRNYYILQITVKNELTATIKSTSGVHILGKLLLINYAHEVHNTINLWQRSLLAPCCVN